jgi:hypothetical protein
LAKMINKIVHLKSGKNLLTRGEDTPNFTPYSFTENTVHSMVLRNGNQIFIQGDRIDYIEFDKYLD